MWKNVSFQGGLDVGRVIFLEAHAAVFEATTNRNDAGGLRAAGNMGEVPRQSETLARTGKQCGQMEWGLNSGALP